MREPIIKKGDKFNRLTAVKFDHRDKYGYQHWLFKCSCGKEKAIKASDVKSGHTKSCGCLQRERIVAKSITHGMSNTREYDIWVSMKQRCLDKNSYAYKSYGGRGITICKNWIKFENFFEDMGKKPVGTSIDRIDNSKGYSPENCRWATRTQQNNNTRSNHLLTYKSKTMTMAQWARETGINYGTLICRINKYNWSIKRALNKIKK